MRGHIALLQSCTQEDVPTETGWLWHDSLWTYNASFAAHVYLWAGLRDWAHRTFTGFLNHASPLYCWREEQPLQHALVGQDWGDMPHNWASAECVRYLRHMLALEDGKSLRLLNGITAAELIPTAHYSLQNSPTRFGRINLELEPAGAQGWRLRFDRASGLSPVVRFIAGKHRRRCEVKKVIGAGSKINGGSSKSIHSRRNGMRFLSRTRLLTADAKVMSASAARTASRDILGFFLTLGLCFRGGLALPVARPPCSPHTAYLVEQTLNAPGLTACRLRGGRCRKLGLSLSASWPKQRTRQQSRGRSEANVAE